MAQELLQEKDYAPARALLETLPGDETAQRWLARLDEIAPAAPAAFPIQEQRSESMAAMGTATQWEYCEIFAGYELDNRARPTGDYYVAIRFYTPDGLRLERQTRTHDEGRKASEDDLRLVSRVWAKDIVAQLGMDGWELVNVFHDEAPEANSYYFKRPR
ncbi:MAG: hypothetical protein GYB67_05205 [Chloroflexi bacterium]|nr:hypothetical protein [Chloroflexota bacterium]